MADNELNEAEEAAGLDSMTEQEEVIADYRTGGLSLTAHPLAFERARLAARGVLEIAAANAIPEGRRICVAGIALCRQRPGVDPAAGFVQQDRGRDRHVERLDPTRERDRHERVAGAAHEWTQALPLRAEHDRGGDAEDGERKTGRDLIDGKAQRHQGEDQRQQRARNDAAERADDDRSREPGAAEAAGDRKSVV